jgi:hypothetical protein
MLQHKRIPGVITQVYDSELKRIVSQTFSQYGDDISYTTDFGEPLSTSRAGIMSAYFPIELVQPEKPIEYIQAEEAAKLTNQARIFNWFQYARYENGLLTAFVNADAPPNDEIYKTPLLEGIKAIARMK